MSEHPQPDPSASTPTPTELPIQKYYRTLHEKCGSILETSVAEPGAAKVARSQQFVSDMEVWTAVLSHRKEVGLITMAAHEYQYGLLAMAQGHYRHAFKGLRLVLELTLQAVHLSAHELELREWFENRKDTVWRTLIDNTNGVFSARFARAFFPAVEKHMAYHADIAEQLYRECSECVHGNIPKRVPLPKTLAYSGQSFDLWHAKADVVALLAHFVLSVRYLLELQAGDIAKLEPILTPRVGHIQELRVALGGPQGG